MLFCKTTQEKCSSWTNFTFNNGRIGCALPGETKQNNRNWKPNSLLPKVAAIPMTTDSWSTALVKWCLKLNPLPALPRRTTIWFSKYNLTDTCTLLPPCQTPAWTPTHPSTPIPVASGLPPCISKPQFGNSISTGVISSRKLLSISNINQKK